jgi:DNA-binding MarR family transcriptional regulator
MGRRVRPTTMYLLHQASHAMRARLEQSLRQLEMTGIKYTVLAIVGNRENLSSAELSRRFFVTPQTMNEIVGDLTRRGLVDRREDAESRRILRLRLTTEGRRMLDRCAAIANRIESEFLGSFPKNDLHDLRVLLQNLLSSLRGQNREVISERPARIRRAG